MNLSQPARDALEIVVQANVNATICGLRVGPLPSSPLYAVSLWPAEDPLHLDAYPISAGSDSDRQNLLRSSLSPYRKFNAAWNAAEYAVEEIGSPNLRDRGEFTDAEAMLGPELEGLGILDPARWVLNRVARRLGDTDLGVSITTDFVAFVVDKNFSEDLLEGLWFAAPPTVAQSLRQQGLLPADLKGLEELAAASGEEGWV